MVARVVQAMQPNVILNVTERSALVRNLLDQALPFLHWLVLPAHHQVPGGTLLISGGEARNAQPLLLRSLTKKSVQAVLSFEKRIHFI